jgi:VanZ family protein
LCVTSILLLIPGSLTLWLAEWAYQWWPWPSSGIASADYPVDKLVHVLLFALCGYLFCKEWIKTSRKVAILYALFFIYGLLIELLQILIPGRGASVGDLIADNVGVVIGFYLAIKAANVAAARLNVRSPLS